MKTINAKKVLEEISDLRRRVEEMPEAIDRKQYISIEFLRKQLVDEMYNRAIDHDAMNAFYRIVERWEKNV